MLFEVVFRFELLMVQLFHLVVNEFCCIKLFDVVYFFLNQTFLRFLV